MNKKFKSYSGYDIPRSGLGRMAALGIVRFKDGGEDEGEGAPAGKTPEQIAAEAEEARKSADALKKKNDEIIAENRKLKESMKAWEGLDAEEVRGLLDQFNNNEEMKLLAEGKHDEVIKKRTEKIESQYKADLKKLQDERDDLAAKNQASSTRIRDLMIDSNVVAAFVAEKGLETAVPDVVLRAKSVFTVEDGEVIARDSSGEIITGKDGPLTIKEWAASLKETAPHLFPSSQGSGAQGNNARGLSGIDAKISAAAKSGDVAEYRRLRAQKEKIQRGEEK